jgi:hypothetical protein
LFQPRRDLTGDMRARLDYVMVRGEPLDLPGARAEARLLLARLAERDEGVASARAHLNEARTLVAPLRWLSLEQQINAEIRRLGAASSPAPP